VGELPLWVGGVYPCDFGNLGSRAGKDGAWISKDMAAHGFTGFIGRRRVEGSEWGKLRETDLHTDFPFALTGLDFRIALLISLPIIAFGISKPVRWLASTHNERTLLRTAWANNWLEFYPVLVGNFYHFDTKAEKNPVGDDHYYFHRARIMVFFPDGSTEVLPELATVKAVDYPPELMRSDGTAIAENPRGSACEPKR